MRRLMVFIVCVAGLLASVGTFAADTPRLFVLEGREIAVRLYGSVSQNGKAYETVYAQIRDRSFECNRKNTDGVRNIQVFARDQQDSVVRHFVTVVGSSSYGPQYQVLRWSPDDEPPYRLAITTSELEGTELAARLYWDVKAKPWSYEMLTMRIFDRRVTFDIDGIDDANNTAIVVAGPDQKDTLLKQLLRCRTWAWRYKKGMCFLLPIEQPTVGDEELSWTFLDALGNPIGGAKLQAYLVPQDRRVAIEQYRLDENGQVKVDFCVGCGGEIEDRSIRRGLALMVISHPDYGTAWVEPSACGSPYVLYTPLLRRNNPAYERRVRGVVVDPDGQPVSAAQVTCKAVRPPGGEKVKAERCQNVGVDTDIQGRFELYLPVEQMSLQIGVLIPPGTKYLVRIEPPKGLDLLPFEGEILNDGPTRTALEWRGYSRTFVFENEDGPITDPHKLRAYTITIKRPGKLELKLKYDGWKNGAVVPPGRFEARTSKWGGCKFEPLDVTADSPEQLVFKLNSGEQLYFGQIVDAVSGEPIEGAFVIDMRRQQDGVDLSSVTDKQWDALEKLPAALASKAKCANRALRPVFETYLFEQVVRSDANGWFEMPLPAGTGIEHLLVFERGYLDARVPLASARSGEYGGMELPIVKLFAAARVAFEPWFKAPKGWPRQIVRRWFIDKNRSGDWANDLLGWCDRPEQVKTSGFLFYGNTGFSFYVPAGLKLRIELRGLQSYLWSVPLFAEIGPLRQGELLRLSLEQINPGVGVFAEVVTSQAEPIEAVPVKACDQYGEVIHNTDLNGIAIFELPVGSKGEFIVECDADDDPNTPSLREAIPYQISGPQDANNVYTLQLSDEMLRALFK